MDDSAGTVEKDGAVDYDVSPVGVINGPLPTLIDMHSFTRISCLFQHIPVTKLAVISFLPSFSPPDPSPPLKEGLGLGWGWGTHRTLLDGAVLMLRWSFPLIGVSILIMEGVP